jgi:hypothetical protein
MLLSHPIVRAARRAVLAATVAIRRGARREGFSHEHEINQYICKKNLNQAKYCNLIFFFNIYIQIC